MAKTMRDWPIDTVMLTRERMADGEVREVLYRREPDGPVRYPYNVRVGRIVTMQGVPGDDEGPRYRRQAVNGICHDPGEADGRTPVIGYWESAWPHEILEAVRSMKEG